jgi:hypothetical protein
VHSDGIREILSLAHRLTRQRARLDLVPGPTDSLCVRANHHRDLRIQRLRPFPGWVKNFIGQWTDTTLRAILVVVVGQLARDLLTVHTVADMPSAVGLVDVSLFAWRKSIGPSANVQRLFPQVQ